MRITTAIAVLFLAATARAATVTVNLHPFGPVPFLNAGVPEDQTLELTSNLLTLTLATNEGMNVDYGTALLAVSPEGTGSGHLDVPFIFDVSKGSTTVTHGATRDIYNASRGFGTPTNDRVQVSYYDFSDGTSFSIILYPFTNTGPVGPFPLNVDLIAAVAYFPTAQLAPLPEPRTLWLFVAGGVLLLLHRFWLHRRA